MAWIVDLLKDVPLSAVLKERLEFEEARHQATLDENAALLDENATLSQKVAALESELSQLREKNPEDSTSGLNDDARRILVYLFENYGNRANCAVRPMCRNFEINEGMLEYHLDDLAASGLAQCTGSNYRDGNVFWGITEQGRRFVVQNQMVSTQGKPTGPRP